MIVNAVVRGRAYKVPERLLQPDILLAGFRGSIAHGTHVPSTDPDSIDDVDWLAVKVCPLDFYYGIGKPEKDTEEVFAGDDDIVVYELVKFCRLMRACNPNVIATLWAPEHLCAISANGGELLVAIREAFLSKRLYAPFIGYARSQLQRMTGFGNEKQQYKGAKRRELIERFGYDCKNAAHLIRILRMGIEALDGGGLRIERPDAEQLIEIKTGKWKLEQVQQEAARLFELAERARNESKLAEEPDHALIDSIIRRILEWHHGGRYAGFAGK